MSTETTLEKVERVLAEHDLPVRLLPRSIRSGEIDEATGAFDVELDAETERTFEGIRVSYARRVRGRIRDRAVDDLNGVKAKRGIWVPVTAIRAEGASLVFSVGPASKALPRSAFE